jgi:hypothetical protein
MITALLIALWASVATGCALSVVLLPLSRLVGMAQTSFSRLLYKFLLSVASLQVLNVITPIILLASYYGWITSPDLTGWLYVSATAFIVIENIVVTIFAIWMRRRLNGAKD